MHDRAPADGSEERFRSIADAAPVMIWVAEPERGCTWVSRPWLAFTGRPLERELGAGWLEGVHPEDRARCLEVYAAAAAALAPFSMEYRLRRADGEYRWLLDRGAPRWAGGAFAGYVGSAVDITDRLAAERRAARLHQLTARLAAALTPADVVAAVLEEGLPALGASAGSVVRLDGDQLELVGSVGYVPEVSERWGRFPLAARTLMSEAVAAGGPALVASPEEFERRYGRPPDPSTLSVARAWLALPLAVAGRVLGVIGITYGEPRTLDAETMRFAEALAGLCAQALDRSRLFEVERRSEERYRSLVEASAQVVWRTDGAGALLDWRARWSALSGLPADALPDDPLALVHDEDRAPGDRLWWDAFARRAALSFEQRVRWADGTYRYWHVRAAPVLEPDGRVREWIGTDTDITERRRAEEAAREEQARRLAEEREHAARLQRLNAASLAITAAQSREEVLRAITEQARALIGARQGVTTTVEGGDWSTARHTLSLSERHGGGPGAVPDGSGVDALVLSTGAPLRLTAAELAAHPALGGALPAPRGLLAAPLVARDGRGIGLIQLSDRDAGEFTAADEALLLQLAQLAAVALENQSLLEQEQRARAQAEEASRLKDEFLATVSHELRTPLTAYLGYAQMLQSRRRDEAYVGRTLEKMVRSARAQAQLIDDLLDVSRIVGGVLRIEPRPTDLAAVVRSALDTVRPAADARAIQIATDLDPDAAAVVGDAGRLQQVVWNLLSNAVKFTPPGGAVRVALGRRGREAVLTVGDTGQGIAADFLPFVFDRFRQADSTSRRVQSGLGLGLAIVRHLVELHGGSVRAESDGPGLGATFTVALPLAAAAAGGGGVELAEELGRAEECPPELRGARVLVVDDQPDLLDLLAEVLDGCGAEVRACCGAREALAVLREWRPDALVSDIAMPGEDGYWLIRSVRALPPEEGGATPAAALTAYVRAEDRARVLAAGFQAYAPKPIDPPVLRAAVARLLTPA